MGTRNYRTAVPGIVATGWSEKHFLVPEYQLKPVLSYFKGLIPTGNVFIQNDVFNDESGEIIDRNIAERIQKLTEEMIYLQKGIHHRS